MTNTMKKSAFIICVLLVLCVISQMTSLTVYADTTTRELTGSFYDFGDNEDYRIDNYSYDQKMSTKDSSTLGSPSIQGEFAREYSKDGFPAYEIADGTVFSLSYAYNSKLLNAASEEWHLTEDSNDIVNGVELDDKIRHGAVILQTSFDRSKWFNSKVFTDVTNNISIKKDDGINDIQLINGCWYRLLVAYETEKTTKGSFDITDITSTKLTSNENKYYAEAYVFYASYKDTKNEVSGEEFNFPVGPKEKYTKKTAKNDYVGSKTVDSKDPHYGWELGKFSLCGYTDKGDKEGDNEEVYLKTVGNKIKLTFTLNYDINKLNGNSDYVIASDKNGSDGDLQIPAHNMGHGELIVKHTDYKNNTTITQYSNYLEALASPAADTTIQVFEEGDYEVFLDYAITDNSKFNKFDNTTYYKTSFNFKIRNGNCMVYTFDTSTGEELLNKDVTENGFRIDTAKSGYPQIMVKKENLNEGATGMTEDTRFNRAATDGEVFTEEGIYTITAVNRYNDQLKTEKVIYVGSDNILLAYVKHYNEKSKEYEYSIEELNDLVNNKHAEIKSNGEIVIPVVQEVVDESDLSLQSEHERSIIDSAEMETTNSDDVSSKEDNKSSSGKIVIGAVVGAAVIGSFIIVSKRKKINKERRD